MGSVGISELILIFVLALILFGPRKLPEIGRGLGKALGEFRRASNDLKRAFEEEVDAESLRDLGRDVRDTLGAPPDSALNGSGKRHADAAYDDVHVGEDETERVSGPDSGERE